MVTIAPTGESALDQDLKDSSSLLSLQTKAPVGPFALISRAQDDRQRLITALHAWGYYKGTVQIRIGDMALDDGKLPDHLQHLTGKDPVKITVTTTRGPRYRIGSLTINGPVTPDERAALGIKQNDPAVAAPILAAKTALLAAIQEQGHALAKVDGPVVTENDAKETLSITYTVHPGPRVEIGMVTFSGLTNVDPDYIRRHLTLHPGEVDKPSTLETARQDLAGIGVFSSVQITGADKPDPDNRVPIHIQFAERPLHVVGLTGAYSTDLGGSAAVTWSDRNLFGQAEQLNLKAAAIDLGGSATDGVGYDFDAQLIKPDLWRRDQSLTLNLEAIKQYLIAYDQRAILTSAIINRKINPHWSVSGGVQGEQEQITQEGGTEDYTLAGIPLGAKFDNTDNLLQPTKGFRVALNATPTVSLTGGDEFTLLRVAASTYVDLSGNGQSVVALRAVAATVQGEGSMGVPPDQRIYAGGSDTIRGYKYQIVGPQFPDRNPVGGSQLGAATVELRQHVWGDFGMAAFADAGEVTGTTPVVNGVKGADLSGKLAVGAGLGVRYATPIGPVRVDIALPLVKFPGNDSLEFYIGIGETF